VQNAFNLQQSGCRASNADSDSGQERGTAPVVPAPSASLAASAPTTTPTPTTLPVSVPGTGPTQRAGGL